MSGLDGFGYDAGIEEVKEIKDVKEVEEMKERKFEKGWERRTDG